MNRRMTDRWRVGDIVLYQNVHRKILIVDSALRSVDPDARTTYKLENVRGWVPETELQACAPTLPANETERPN